MWNYYVRTVTTTTTTTNAMIVVVAGKIIAVENDGRHLAKQLSL